MLIVFKTACDCLLISEPKSKCHAVFEFQNQFDSEELDFTALESVNSITVPGRPEIPLACSTSTSAT